MLCSLEWTPCILWADYHGEISESLQNYSPREVPVGRLKVFFRQFTGDGLASCMLRGCNKIGWGEGVCRQMFTLSKTPDPVPKRGLLIFQNKQFNYIENGIFCWDDGVLSTQYKS